MYQVRCHTAGYYHLNTYLEHGIDQSRCWCSTSSARQRDRHSADFPPGRKRARFLLSFPPFILFPIFKANREKKERKKERKKKAETFDPDRQ